MASIEINIGTVSMVSLRLYICRRSETLMAKNQKWLFKTEDWCTMCSRNSGQDIAHKNIAEHHHRSHFWIQIAESVPFRQTLKLYNKKRWKPTFWHASHTVIWRYLVIANAKLQHCVCWNKIPISPVFLCSSCTLIEFHNMHGYILVSIQ